jgi:hypothetical protein
MLSGIPLEGTLGCQWRALTDCLGKGLQADQVGRLWHSQLGDLGMGSWNALVVVEQDGSYAAMG